MTKLELNRLIAERVLGMEMCRHWRPVNYNTRRSIFGDTIQENSGPMLLRDPQRCPHKQDACYPSMQIGTSFGIVGGVPQYCEKSRAALALLNRLQDRAEIVTLQKSVDRGKPVWTLTMLDWMDDPAGGDAPVLVPLADPAPAWSCEMAIALTAAGLAGVALRESDVTE